MQLMIWLLFWLRSGVWQTGGRWEILIREMLHGEPKMEVPTMVTDSHYIGTAGCMHFTAKLVPLFREDMNWWNCVFVNILIDSVVYPRKKFKVYCSQAMGIFSFFSVLYLINEINIFVVFSRVKLYSVPINNVLKYSWHFLNLF